MAWQMRHSVQNGALIPERVKLRADQWKLARFLAERGRCSCRGACKVRGVQGAITRTAVGAARTSMRLASVAAQIRRTNGAYDSPFVKGQRWGGAVLLGWNTA